MNFANCGRHQKEWRPFAYVAIDHQPLAALEQWKAFKYWVL